MQTIGVISDTHGYLDPRAYAALASADTIIHAGDICAPSILRELETLAPVIAVRGNCDYDEYGEDVGMCAKPVIEGVRFLVAHFPEDVQLRGFGARAFAPGEALPDVCIHGHTHVPKLLRGAYASPAQLIMCPGSATRPRGGSVRSVGFICVEDGRVLRAWIEDFGGNVIA